MGATWALHEAWELGGRRVWRPGCGGQRAGVEASVWVPAGGGRRAGRGWSGAWRGSGLSFVSCRNPPFRVIATWRRLVLGLACPQGTCTWAAGWALGQPQPTQAAPWASDRVSSEGPVPSFLILG